MASEIRSKILVWVDSFKDKIVEGWPDKCPEDLVEAGWLMYFLVEVGWLMFFSVEELRNTVVDHSSLMEAVNLTGKRLMYEIECAITLNPGNVKTTLKDEYGKLEILMRRQEREYSTADEVNK